jgi:hypothetical protein
MLNAQPGIGRGYYKKRELKKLRLSIIHSGQRKSPAKNVKSVGEECNFRSAGFCFRGKCLNGIKFNANEKPSSHVAYAFAARAVGVFTASEMILISF